MNNFHIYEEIGKGRYSVVYKVIGYIKFILLMTGIFLFTLGYVNQNKYNCNIIPSLDKKDEDQDLGDLFYKKDVF